MKEYDILVLGDGSAGSIVQNALMQGNKVALVDKGVLGGTCLNYGCIPSKMLIYPADRIMEIKESNKLGIETSISNIDFQNIMNRMRNVIRESHKHMKGIDKLEGLDYYNSEGKFIDDYTLVADNKKIKGEKVFIGTGARPLIPEIKGLDKTPYLTNETVLDLKKQPDSIAIVGGGYIAVEFAHFFSSIGTEITIFQRGDRLINNSEPEISRLLEKKLKERMNIFLNTEVVEIKRQKNKIEIIGKDKNSDKRKTYNAEKVLIAAGRKSNADILKVENTGVETDKRGYIKVNKYLETTKKNIWAIGDATGNAMFKHVANEEAYIAWNNATNKENRVSLNYNVIPYAVFTYPQIAAVGLTEKQASKNHNILVGYAKYSDVAKGEAMVEKDGFAKTIVDQKTKKILGFHIIGPYAPILIQEVTNAMALGGQIGYIARGMHIHPALNELILDTFGNLKKPKDK